MARRKRNKILQEIPGTNHKAALTLIWLVNKGWFWRNEAGIHGANKPPKRMDEFEAFVTAMVQISVAPDIARSGGSYEGELRFSVRSGKS